MKITKDTIIADVPKINPKGLEIMKKWGVNECLSCETAKTEGLEHLEGVHCLDMDKFLADLNEGLE